MDRPARQHRYTIPDRAVVVEWLKKLESGKATRAEVSEWASEYILFENEQIYPEVSDPKVWQALQHLMGADLRDGPHSYLHGEDDFKAWRDELEAT